MWKTVMTTASDGHYALLSALPAINHTNRPTKFPVDDGFNSVGIDTPTPISQIQRVEKQNNLPINIFGWNTSVIVHHLSNQPLHMPKIILLLIEKTKSSITPGLMTSTGSCTTRVNTSIVSTSASAAITDTHVRIF